MNRGSAIPETGILDLEQLRALPCEDRLQLFFALMTITQEISAFEDTPCPIRVQRKVFSSTKLPQG